MRVRLAAIKDRISQALHLILHVLLGPNAERADLPAEHIFEELQVLLDGIRAMLTLNALISLQFHLLSWRVVSVRQTLLDQSFGVSLDLLEIVGGVSDLVGGNVECFQITRHILGELDLFVHGVRVVKAQNHFALVHARVVEIHQGCLAVTNVEVTGGFGWESSHYLTHLGTL